MSSISQPPPLPGFGLPLDYDPECDDDERKLFPNVLNPNSEERDYETRLPMLTLREIAMLQFMDQITDKNEWERKIFDDIIAEKWKAEVLQAPDIDFTKEMADYCIEELRYKADIYRETGLIRVYNGDVVKSDSVIPSDLRLALKAAVAPLEDVPKHKRDWHPGSNDMVLDLVHPSLFPLVYGLSRILKDDTVNLESCITRCGQGEVVPEPSATEATAEVGWRTRNIYSTKFQWLPCDVDISGNTPKILSYINNLHPQDHAELYSVIEKIIAHVIPLWNATLTPLRALEDIETRILYDNIDYGELEDYANREGPKQEDDEDEDEYWDRREEWKDAKRKEFLVLPNPKPFVRPNTNLLGAGSDKGDVNKAEQKDDGGDNGADDKVDLKRDFGATGLQIIVKLANIHLTPEKPEYEGGTWHVEGQLNEHICATAIYYYDNENITPSRLAFRQQSSTIHIEEEIPYEQSEWAWLEHVYGLQNDEPAIQVVGSIDAREGRVVTFPNILQHQVQPFKLADPTKPGHRKILVLFLVDPNIKIISTANIPCQRFDWWGRAVTSSTDVLAKLPVELKDKVIQSVEGFLISLERAHQLREDLMTERKEYVMEYQTRNFKYVTISLCEH